MSSRSWIRPAIWAAVLFGGAALLVPPAQAGTYTVRSCFPDGINHTWSGARNNLFADAYVQCPHEMGARNVKIGFPAPGYMEKSRVSVRRREHDGYKQSEWTNSWGRTVLLTTCTQQPVRGRLGRPLFVWTSPLAAAVATLFDSCKGCLTGSRAGGDCFR